MSQLFKYEIREREKKQTKQNKCVEQWCQWQQQQQIAYNSLLSVQFVILDIIYIKW